MSGFRKFFISAALLGLTFSTAFSQAARSPFSSFGIGEYYGNSLVYNRGMAGVGVSNPQTLHLNYQNPALLVFNQLTTFEAGFLVEKRTARNADTKESNAAGNLNYLTIGFPVKYRKWSTSLGLMPYTNVNYKLTYTQNIVNSAAVVNVNEEGSGGLNQFSWANGVAITRGISVGAKVNYVFSSINRSFDNQLPPSAETNLIIPSIHTRQNFSDFTFTGGLSMRKDSISRKNLRLNFGLVYDFKANVKTKYYEAVELRSTGRTLDTLINNEIRKTTIPQTLTAGLSFGRPDYWTVGTDFTWLDYTKYRNIDGSTENAITGWKLALGGEVTPNPLSLSSYLKRMTYRTGISLEHYPYLVNGNTLKDFGINFGLSTPVSRYSSLDFAVKLGKRGDLKTNTVVENYFKIYFGVTFNDQWFIKRRFD
jgi:hypothetical protein